MKHVFPIISIRMCPLAALALACFGYVSVQAWDLYPTDPLRANRHVASSPAKAELADALGNPCKLAPLPARIDLPRAAEYALCANPKTRVAWANVKALAAQVGGAEAAYLPTLSGTVLAARDHSLSEVPRAPIFNADNPTHYRSETASLSWLIYDFGARSAALEQARSLLDAAQASQDAAIQTVLTTVAHDYYTASAAQAILDSTTQIEQASRKSLLAATERVKGGVAPITDQLQAQTAHAQAVFNHAKAEGEVRMALGTLLLDLGVAPNINVELAGDSDPNTEIARSDAAIASLLDDAQRDHPSLVAARANVDAAQAKVSQARAQGRPSLTLSSHVSHSTQPVSPSLGSAELPAIGRDRYVGVQLDIPLFEGLTRTYQIRQAQAQVEVQKANLADAEQQVAQEVWRSYQGLQTEVENLRNSATLLDSAQQSFDAAQHRYDRGVGNILELLSAQTALANAQQQRVQALADWRIGKVQLMGSLGRLSMAAMK